MIDDKDVIMEDGRRNVIRMGLLMRKLLLLVVWILFLVIRF